MAIVTISRLTGSGGREIATATAQALNFQFIDRNAMDVAIDQQFPVRTERLSRIKKDRRVYDEMVRSAIAELAASHNVVILGSGAQFLFAKVAASLHIQIVAPLPYRIAQVMRLARVAAGHVFTQPWPAGPSRPGPDILGSCFVLRVEAKIPHRSEGMGIDARATRGRRSQDQAAG